MSKIFHSRPAPLPLSERPVMKFDEAVSQDQSSRDICARLLLMTGEEKQNVIFKLLQQKPDVANEVLCMMNGIEPIQVGKTMMALDEPLIRHKKWIVSRPLAFFPEMPCIEFSSTPQEARARAVQTYGLIRIINKSDLQ